MSTGILIATEIIDKSISSHKLLKGVFKLDKIISLKIIAPHFVSLIYT